MNQMDRMAAVEKFQRGDADFLLATDLVARGLDISAVKSVLNFTFPVEPKRYLHRVGRTARAGSHGVALTLCNDEERKDIKKLVRKLGQNLTTYMVPPRLVKQLHDFITDRLDPVIREIELEQIQDKEMQLAYREAERAENMVKFKDEINSRPKNEWHKSVKQKKEVQKESRAELPTIRSKFDEYSTKVSKEVTRKRDKKREEKEQAREAKAAGGSLFGVDQERTKKKERQPKPSRPTDSRPEPERERKDPAQDAKERKKFRGKRNSTGAKMAGFKGGEHKNFRRSGGAIGNRDLSGRVRQDRTNRGGVAPEGSGKKKPANKTKQRPGQTQRLVAKQKANTPAPSGE